MHMRSDRGLSVRSGPAAILLVLAIVFGVLTPPSFAAVRVVIHADDDAAPGGDGSGLHPYNNLLDAVTAARSTPAAAVVQVAPGDYVVDQPIVIDFPLELRGSTAQVDDPDDPWPTGEVTPGTQTRIFASGALGSRPLIAVGRGDGDVLDGFRISGFVLEGTSSGNELELTRVQGYRVVNNVFRAPAALGVFATASSGTVTGNHFSGLANGATFAGGYPASPSTVAFRGNRSVRNILGGVVLNGSDTFLPEVGDHLDATLRDNDISDNSPTIITGFGLRVFVIRKDLGRPGDTQSSGNVHAVIQDNRISGNPIGMTIDAGFPFRRVGGICDPRVYSGTLDLSLTGNSVIGSRLTPALLTFTRITAATAPSTLSQWQYLHGASYVISDADGSLAGAWIDHPAVDPFVGPCPADATQEPLENAVVYNGATLPFGRNF